MKMSKLKKELKKFVASMLVISLLITSSGMQNLSVSAASGKTYVSDFVLYTGTKENAKKTFSDYTFLDKSLNGTSDGADSVYLGYKTTTDKNQAIRDIAFMQMGGAYSISDYEKVLEDNAELARITVEEYKNVVEEFRTNYNSTDLGKKKLADQAYELLNKYYEEDTGLHMGDFFLNVDGKVTDENYVTLVMQATSTTLYALLNILAKGIDTDVNATWIDRLVSYNGFEGLCKANGFDINNESSKKQAMDQLNNLYSEQIKYLTENIETEKDGETVSVCAWDEFAHKLEKYADSLKETTEELSENANDKEKPDDAEEAAEEINDSIEDSQAFIYSTIYELLSKVEYKDGTLYDLFTTPSTNMKPEDFYPIIAALSEGQKTIMINNGFEILISSIAEQAVASDSLDSVVDINEEEIEKNMDKSADEVQEINVEEQVKNIDNIIDDVYNEVDDEVLDNIIKEDAISVYAGVDRGFFEKGVAMTSEASSSDDSNDRKWNTNKILQISSYISFGVGVTCMVAGGIVISAGEAAASSVIANSQELIIAQQEAFIENSWSVFDEAEYALEIENNIKGIQTEAQAAARQAYSAYGIAGKALIGIGLVLVTYSIVAQIISLVKKDKPHYTEIPKKMVDATNKDKTDMESFLYYNAVFNKDGEAQDLNNWTREKWLAMYASKSKDAGAPILADSFKIQSDSNNTTGMTSAHLFGETGAYNMLTYKSANNSKLFMYFNKDNKDNAASVFGKNTLIVTISLLAVFCAVVAFEITRNKKKKKDMTV